MARNEDGDESGWGSRTFFASHDDLSEWHFVGDESDQWIYESPKMFRHGSDLYLVARTDPGWKRYMFFCLERYICRWSVLEQRQSTAEHLAGLGASSGRLGELLPEAARDGHLATGH